MIDKFQKHQHLLPVAGNFELLQRERTVYAPDKTSVVSTIYLNYFDAVLRKESNFKENCFRVHYILYPRSHIHSMVL